MENNHPKDTPASSKRCHCRNGLDGEGFTSFVHTDCNLCGNTGVIPATSGSADQAVREVIDSCKYQTPEYGYVSVGKNNLDIIIQTAEQAAELLKHRDHLNEEVGKLYERDQSLRRRVKDLEGALEEISASDLSHKWVKLHAKEAINQSRSGEKV